MGKTLKYFYVPVIQNAIQFADETFDVLITGLDIIPFYKEQNYDQETRLKIARVLTMFNLIELINDEELKDSIIQMKVDEFYQLLLDYVLRGDEKIFEVKQLREFKEWYDKQNIKYQIFDVEDDTYDSKGIEIWGLEEKVDMYEIFTKPQKKNQSFNVKLILTPDRTYPYLKEGAKKFLIISKDYGGVSIQSKCIIYYLLGENQLLNATVELEVDYKPSEVYLKFDVDGREESMLWKEYDSRTLYARNGYAIDLTNYFSEEFLKENYQIIVDEMKKLREKYPYFNTILNYDYNHIGIEKGEFIVYDKVIVKITQKLINEIMKVRGMFTIRNSDFYNDFVKAIGHELVRGTIDDEIRIEKLILNQDFVNFSKDLYMILVKLSEKEE